MNYPGGYHPYTQGSGQPYQANSNPSMPLPSPYPSNSFPTPNSSYGLNPTSYGLNPSQNNTNSSPYPSNPSPYPSNPSPYPSNPSPYPSNPSPYPSAPSPYPSNQSPYPSNPSQYPSNPSPYPSNPSSNSTPYPSTPSPYPSAPSPYPSNQSPYPSNSSQYPSNPSPYPSNPSSNSTPYSSTPSPYPSNPSPYPSNSNYGLTPTSYGLNPTENSSNTSYPTNASPYLSKASPYPPPAQPSSLPPSRPLPPQPSINTSAHSSPYSSQPSNPITPSSYPSLSNPSAQCNAYPSPKPVAPQSRPYPQQSHSGASPSTHSQNNRFSKGTPTVKPAHPFDPKKDAEILRKAMKGFGTDEKAIIQVLANRTNAQRLQIEHNYKTMFGKDLKENLQSELSGNFEKLVLSLMTPTLEFQAQQLHWAISGIGTDEKTLIEFLCSATNREIHAVRETYERLFKSSLENDIIGDTSGYFQRLLVSLCQGRRNENYAVDESAAAQDAQALMEAGELRIGTDEATFNMILCNRSYPQLAQVFHQYKMFSGNDIDKAIKSEFSGDIETGLLAIVKCVRDKPGFFAEQLYKSMKGLGTNDRALIRLVVLRSEIDMLDIKRAFLTNYGKSLEQFIEGDTSGDYKRCLLALIKE